MQTRINKHAKSARVHFDSLHEMGEYIARSPRVWRANLSRNNTPSLEWDLRAGYDGALNMARNGWIEGAQKAQDALQAFAPKTPAPDTRTDVYGFRPHVPRFCAGAPDSMIRHTTVAESGAGKVLTLVVNVVASAYTDARCMANFGVAVAQYINQLEKDGTRVEVIGAVGEFGAGWRSVVSFTIKNADQPLDLAVLTFAIGHPAMLRRIWFAFIERQNNHPEMSAYGTPQNVREDDLINAPPGVVVLNGMKDANRYAPTPAKGLEYVSRVIDAALKAQEL